MAEYQVIVGNVGLVCKTRLTSKAEVEFKNWVALSKMDRGRAGGEPVTLVTGDGEILEEYHGRQQNEDGEV